ncbi:MAG: hypothetical protein M3071_21905 [Actinomycetota bacterium]|nr:hypothetical protein [Actinomycetota bacterium]
MSATEQVTAQDAPAPGPARGFHRRARPVGRAQEEAAAQVLELLGLRRRARLDRPPPRAPTRRARR